MTDATRLEETLREMQATIDAQQTRLEKLEGDLTRTRTTTTVSPEEAESGPTSRRSFFGKAIVAGAVGVAGVASSAQHAAAATGDNFVLGQANSANAQTSLTGTGFHVDRSGSGETTAAISATHSGNIGRGVVGSGGNFGILGQSQAGAGVLGEASGSGFGVIARSNSQGVPFQIQSNSVTGALPTGTNRPTGSFFVDDQGDLYFCTAGGDPGTWVRLNGQSGQVSFLSAPARAFDSRSGRAPIDTAAGNKGVFTSGSTRVIDLTVAGGVTAGAPAVLVNLTVVNTATDSGFVSVYSGDEADKVPPSFSNLNWFGRDQILANTTATAVGAAGTIKIYSSGLTDVIVDVIGIYS